MHRHGQSRARLSDLAEFSPLAYFGGIPALELFWQNSRPYVILAEFPPLADLAEFPPLADFGGILALSAFWRNCRP